MKKAIALTVCASFMFSSVALAADSVTLKQKGVDVVAAATSWTPEPAKPAPAPAAKPAAKPATTKTTQTPTATATTLKLGSKGSAVKDLQTKLNGKGYQLKADGVFGQLTLAAVKDYQSKNGLTVDGIVGAAMMEKLNAAAVATPTPAATPAPAPAPVATTGKTTIKIGRTQYAPHGTKSFADTVVVLAGDKIVGVSIDEYQFMAAATTKAVPNSDSDFGKNYADPAQVLGSKRANVASYSENMKTKGGATIAIDKNLDAVQAYAIGKTVAELEGILAKNTKEQMVDVVSGATLADTHGYLSSIVAAAKEAKANGSIELDAAALTGLKIGRTQYAPHGTKSFADTVVVLSGNQIVGVSIDEYQFMAAATTKAVPNSDSDFGKNYADPAQVLGSKRANVASYSENMKTKGGATIAIDKNLDAVQAYAIGKTVAVLEGTLSTKSKEEMVDVVSGATLADTHGYLSSIVAAAKTVQSAPAVDAVASASIVDNAAAFEQAIGKDGKWIICTLNDLTTDKNLVLEGEFRDKNLPENDLKRKIALYTQDDKKNVTARFTLTAPKLSIKSPNARIQSGTFKGDLYVYAANFQLVDAKVDGNVYFVTQEAKDTFTMDEKSSVTGNKILADVDVVATASLVHDGAAFEKAISKDGTWIVCPLRDLTIDKALVVEGEFRDKNLPENDFKRKIGLYTHNDPNDKKKATHSFTLTAPSITFKSPNSTLQYGTFVGNIFVQSNNFSLVNCEVKGNIYFATQEAMDTFTMDEKSSVSGVKELMK
ncbi:peptidoglycan hydrolase-like protein with peptidoglycan-binding domain [Anaerosolibacter carboniphilus]|uniref:Peptidoglycan hydrolase-like protein with peptidoglycan-binding domain n=1 Tax=Anaerosolibacter carboniphilus TaxID=1417629 RepID=A0A841L2I6_9FIRM|nr:peptidoglycan-binding domain-containing protein [Anaerosolibacter carboniphilus]MBB6217372.1 peptidoglycan hydrolase-like protein with peptidoglycan-binding domain [Anaerosolibacter carboniphilus]